VTVWVTVDSVVEGAIDNTELDVCDIAPWAIEDWLEEGRLETDCVDGAGLNCWVEDEPDEVVDEVAAGSGLNSGNDVDITRVDDRLGPVEDAAGVVEGLLCAASIGVEVAVAEAVVDDLVTETEREEKERLVASIGFTPTAGTAATTPPLLDDVGDVLEGVGPANVVDPFSGICLSLPFLATRWPLQHELTPSGSACRVDGEDLLRPTKRPGGPERLNCTTSM
jgi:hypothetical protein